MYAARARGEKCPGAMHSGAMHSVQVSNGSARLGFVLYLYSTSVYFRTRTLSTSVPLIIMISLVPSRSFQEVNPPDPRRHPYISQLEVRDTVRRWALILVQ